MSENGFLLKEVPSSGNRRENGKPLDYELGRPHPEKRGKQVFHRGGALIQESERKWKTLGNRVGAPPPAKLVNIRERGAFLTPRGIPQKREGVQGYGEPRGTPALKGP
jgi:hypothetical protein